MRADSFLRKFKSFDGTQLWQMTKIPCFLWVLPMGVMAAAVMAAGGPTGGSSIIPINIEDEMRSSYLAYSMSVIIGRALPDVRDGLKPVHRRILYTLQ